eukprot:CAMPEP_0198260152 /NCGR_PEP_ID=MMETSP1447-20131203/9196_1 /TAXON_ID=420782 /ORGANISM="Chaetoceros dichaeta, Strain CCMP1751" /LENGTH=254 /DNA_ID=CAMNT_0043947739 /DNA_START=86 /DNA_END=850 /DNA_ORIENTATION=+
MSDDKLRCAVVYRINASLGAPTSATLLAKYDHASDYESHAGAVDGTLYGGRDKSYAEAVEMVITNDPPGNGEVGSIGGFKVVQSEIHQVIYGSDSNGLCLAVITGLRYPSRIATQMLVELYGEYNPQFGQLAATAQKNALTSKSKSLLTKMCKKYSELDKVDKASAITGKLDGVKVQMQDNIASMLNNIEKTESISNQADQLNEQASVFKKKSTDLRKHMRCKNLKLTIILIVVVLIILIIVLVPVIQKARNKN